MKVVRVVRTLGSVFKVYSVFLLLPLLASMFWDEDVVAQGYDVLPFELKVTTIAFALTFFFVFLLGFTLTSLASRGDDELREREAYFIVGFGWLACAVLGAIPFILSGATRDVTVALFESMSGITTTGFSALTAPLEQYPESVHVWRGTLHFFGGLGVVLVLVAVIGRLTEGAAKLISSETGGGGVTRLRPTLSQTAKSIFGIYITLNTLLFIAYWLAIRFTGETHDWKSSAFHALVHSMGTIATGGMSTRSASLAAFESDWLNWISFVGMFLGGVAFVLYYKVLTQGWRPLTQSHEFRFYLTVLTAAGALVALSLWRAGAALDSSVGHAMHAAITTMTTSGYLITDVDAFPDSAKLVMLFLMFTGGMVGSTGGAIKLGRIYLLLRLTFREFQKLLHPHAVAQVKVAGRILPEDSLRRIVVFFFTYVTVFIAGAIGFALLDFNLQSAIGASASSIGNIGFAFGQVSHGFYDQGPLGPEARMLSLFLMWLGRLEIFSVLLLFIRGTYRN